MQRFWERRVKIQLGSSPTEPLFGDLMSRYPRIVDNGLHARLARILDVVCDAPLLHHAERPESRDAALDAQTILTVAMELVTAWVEGNEWAA